MSVTVSPLAALTGAQLEVLHWIAEGFTNDEVAARMSYSVGTVKSYAIEIFRRLGVRNRVEAAVTYHVWAA